MYYWYRELRCFDNEHELFDISTILGMLGPSRIHSKTQKIPCFTSYDRNEWVTVVQAWSRDDFSITIKNECSEEDRASILVEKARLLPQGGLKNGSDHKDYTIELSERTLRS